MAVIWNAAMGAWRDASGELATTWTTTADQAAVIPAGVATLYAAWKALSDAALDGILWQQASPQTNAPIAGDYPSVTDRAVFLLRYSGSRQPARIEIPAPKGDIFLSGGALVNMSDSRVVNFVNALLAVAGDHEGRALVEVRQGRRQGVRRPPF